MIIVIILKYRGTSPRRHSVRASVRRSKLHLPYPITTGLETLRGACSEDTKDFRCDHRSGVLIQWFIQYVFNILPVMRPYLTTTQQDRPLFFHGLHINEGIRATLSELFSPATSTSTRDNCILVQPVDNAILLWVTSG